MCRWGGGVDAAATGGRPGGVDAAATGDRLGGVDAAAPGDRLGGVDAAATGDRLAAWTPPLQFPIPHYFLPGTQRRPQLYALSIWG